MEQHTMPPVSPIPQKPPIPPMNGRVALYAALCALGCAALIFPSLDRGAFGINLPLCVGLIYALFFLGMRAGGGKVYITRGWPLFPLIALLSAAFALYNVTEILFCNFVALSLLLPGHLALLSGGNVWALEGISFQGKLFYELFARPFAFMAEGGKATLRGGGSRIKTALLIVAGLAAALPLVGILLLLLSFADERFADLLGTVVEHFDVAQLVGIVFLAAAAFFPLLSIAYSLARGKALEGKQLPMRPGPMPPAALCAFLGLVNLILGVFAFIQLGRLFGPAQSLSDAAYSRYAHEGFFPMLVAALLCFGVQSLCLRLTRVKNLPVKALTSLMGASLIVMMASAMQAILRYQAALGLSRLRVYVTVCIAVLFIWLALTLVKIWAGRVPYRAMVCTLLAAALIGINYLNVDDFIARHNIALSRRTGVALDTEYLRRLSVDALPHLEDMQEGTLLRAAMQNEDIRLWNLGRSRVR